jgi:hypothetical protein
VDVIKSNRDFSEKKGERVVTKERGAAISFSRTKSNVTAHTQKGEPGIVQSRLQKSHFVEKKIVKKKKDRH